MAFELSTLQDESVIALRDENANMTLPYELYVDPLVLCLEYERILRSPGST